MDSLGEDSLEKLSMDELERLCKLHGLHGKKTKETKEGRLFFIRDIRTHLTFVFRFN